MEETVGPDGWVREGLMWRHEGMEGWRGGNKGTQRH